MESIAAAGLPHRRKNLYQLSAEDGYNIDPTKKYLAGRMGKTPVSSWKRQTRLLVEYKENKNIGYTADPLRFNYLDNDPTPDLLRFAALVLALQLLSAVIKIPAQDILEAAVLKLRHDLTDLPALPQPAVDLRGDRGGQLPAARVLAGVGGRVVVGGGARCDVVVDDPHVGVAEGLDALELEGAVALL